MTNLERDREKHAVEAALIAGAYATFLGALGIYGPFLATYLEDARGFNPSTTAYLLALMPIATTVSTPLWTFVADRLGSAERVLRVVTLGALFVFASLALLRTGLAFVAIVLVLFAALRAPGTSLLDVIALDWVRRAGGQFGRVRSFGTIGYTLGAIGTSLAVKHFGASSMVAVNLGALLLTVLAVFRLPSAAKAKAKAKPPEAPLLLSALGVLLRRRRFAVFLLTAVLNQVGLGPYDVLFPAWLTHKAGAEYAGIAIALGTMAEVVIMLNARRIIARLGIAGTLALAYAGSSVRWAVVALASAPWLLTAIQFLHGTGYGAFYAAAVALVDEEAPPEVRASGQGIFAMVTWGLAGSGAIVLAAALQPIGGMPLVFTVASGASALGACLTLGLRARPRA